MKIQIDRQENRIEYSVSGKTEYFRFDHVACNEDDSNQEIIDSFIDWLCDQIKESVESHGGELELSCYYAGLVADGWEEDETIGQFDNLSLVYRSGEPWLIGTSKETNDPYEIAKGYNSFGGKEEFLNMVEKYRA